MVYVTTALVNHRAARYRPYRQPLTADRAFLVTYSIPRNPAKSFYFNGLQVD